MRDVRKEILEFYGIKDEPLSEFPHSEIPKRHPIFGRTNPEAMAALDAILKTFVPVGSGRPSRPPMPRVASRKPCPLPVLQVDNS
jgi:hypothetical protein